MHWSRSICQKLVFFFWLLEIGGLAFTICSKLGVVSLPWSCDSLCYWFTHLLPEELNTVSLKSLSLRQFCFVSILHLVPFGNPYIWIWHQKNLLTMRLDQKNPPGKFWIHPVFFTHFRFRLETPTHWQRSRDTSALEETKHLEGGKVQAI